MLKTLNRKITDIYRRRHIASVRRSFADCGCPVDDLEDARLEAAVRKVSRGAEDSTLSPRSIYFALRHLASDGGRSRRPGHAAGRDR